MLILVFRGLTGKSHISINRSPMRGRGRGAAGMRGAGAARGGSYLAAAAARGYRRNMAASDVSNALNISFIFIFVLLYFLVTQ